MKSKKELMEIEKKNELDLDKLPDRISIDDMFVLFTQTTMRYPTKKAVGKWVKKRGFVRVMQQIEGKKIDYYIKKEFADKLK